MLALLTHVVVLLSTPPWVAWVVRIMAPRVYWGSRVQRWSWRHLRWFLPALHVLWALNDHGGFGLTFDLFFAGYWAVICYLFKDDDDDPKRRAQRVAGRVRDLGHRLVIAAHPAPAPA